jgi:hypothetical protein
MDEAAASEIHVCNRPAPKKRQIALKTTPNNSENNSARASKSASFISAVAVSMAGAEASWFIRLKIKRFRERWAARPTLEPR